MAVFTYGIAVSRQAVTVRLRCPGIIAHQPRGGALSQPSPVEYAPTPDGWVAVQYATRALGVSRQTVLQRVKRGELQAVLTRTGRRKGLRIQLPTPENSLF